MRSRWIDALANRLHGAGILVTETEVITTRRSNGLPDTSSKQGEAAILCLLPLAEQNRIVVKFDELMVLCDQLEESITGADDARKKLLDALLIGVSSPTTGEYRVAAQ